MKHSKQIKRDLFNKLRAFQGFEGVKTQLDAYGVNTIVIQYSIEDFPLKHNLPKTIDGFPLIFEKTNPYNSL